MTTCAFAIGLLLSSANALVFTKTQWQPCAARMQSISGRAVSSQLPMARASNTVTMSEGSEESHTPGLAPSRNVLGTELQCCCADVRGTGIGTGFYRDGHCSTGPQDEGRHTVCVQATAEFLRFSAAVGNPLHVPIPEYMFPGVQPGDCWCLCAARWAQALEAEKKGLVSGVVPKLYLRATHEKTLQHVTLEQLMAHALDAEEASAEIARLDEMRTKLQKSVFG